MQHAIIPMLLTLVVLAGTARTRSDDKANEGFKDLFNGKDLEGWVQRGGKAKYRAEDGQIIGSSVPNTPNSFLCTKRDYGDFILELEFKVDAELNSGVQIRSEYVEKDKQVKSADKTIKGPRVFGYQVEIDPDVKRGRLWTGGIYDEGRRGWLKDLKDNEKARKAFKPGEWNKFRIECKGDSIKTWLNGVPAAEIKDSVTPKGFIGLQVHGVGKRTKPLEVRFRNLRIKELKEGLSLRLRSRTRKIDPFNKNSVPTWSEVEKTATWDPKKTALIICDMWDDHWCRSAARRVGEMAGPLNEVVSLARARGVFIIHAPSSTTAFYKDTPQRKLAQNAPFAKTPIPLAQSERWGTAWCWPDGNREGVLPVDDSDMGCDCAVPCKIREAWTRQTATIKIADGDAITDNGQETWNLLTQKGIDNVILCGVHLNMCVLGRPFAIRQMVKLGKNVALMRDFTDTMYNPRRPPGVNHFAGTDLVIAHVEKYWCPSFTSSDLTGKSPFRFKDAPPAGEKR
jgi:nicotinamidase-related amidase